MPGQEYGYIEFKPSADEAFKQAVADALDVPDVIDTEWYGDLLLISEHPAQIDDYPVPEPEVWR